MDSQVDAHLSVWLCPTCFPQVICTDRLLLPEMLEMAIRSFLQRNRGYNQFLPERKVESIFLTQLERCPSY